MRINFLTDKNEMAKPGQFKLNKEPSPTMMNNQNARLKLEIMRELSAQINDLRSEIAQLRNEVYALRNNGPQNDKQLMAKQANEIVRAVVPDVVRAVESRVMERVNSKMNATVNYVQQQTVDGCEAVTQYRKQISGDTRGRMMYFE